MLFFYNIYVCTRTLRVCYPGAINLLVPAVGRVRIAWALCKQTYLVQSQYLSRSAVWNKTSKRFRTLKW